MRLFHMCVHHYNESVRVNVWVYACVNVCVYEQRKPPE